MSKYVDTQIKLTERETATGYPQVTKTWKDFDWVMEEVTGLSLQNIAAGVGPTALSMGSIAKGRLLILVVEANDDGDREPLAVLINGVATWTGLSYLYEADETTGITAVSVTNPGANAINFRYYIGGDIS